MIARYVLDFFLYSLGLTRQTRHARKRMRVEGLNPRESLERDAVREQVELSVTPAKSEMSDREKTRTVFDHRIHQKLATDVIGVSFDAQ